MKTCFVRVRARVDAIDGIWALNLPFLSRPVRLLICFKVRESLEQTKTGWQRKPLMVNIKETVLQIPWERG